MTHEQQIRGKIPATLIAKSKLFSANNTLVWGHVFYHRMLSTQHRAAGGNQRANQTEPGRRHCASTGAEKTEKQALTVG